MATLREWFDAAVPVDLALVKRILADLGEETKAVQDARAALVASYEQLWAEYRHELESKRRLEQDHQLREKAEWLAPIGVRLGAAVRSTQKRLVRPAVWAELAGVGPWYGDRYNTLMADRGSELTRWLTRVPGRTSAYR